jgi:hypothetical protein
MSVFLIAAGPSDGGNRADWQTVVVGEEREIEVEVCYWKGF